MVRRKAYLDNLNSLGVTHRCDRRRRTDRRTEFLLAKDKSKTIGIPSKCCSRLSTMYKRSSSFGLTVYVNSCPIPTVNSLVKCGLLMPD